MLAACVSLLNTLFLGYQSRFSQLAKEKAVQTTYRTLQLYRPPEEPNNDEEDSFDNTRVTM
jgi:hypothetical protein